MRLLIIEDEKRLAENISAALREVGFAVDHAPDGISGSDYATQDVYDAIILDLMLPRRSGQQVLRDVRQNKLRTPILILTAQEGAESTIELLNSGADDYLSKPFDLGELVARIRALVRRASGEANTVLTFPGLEINTIRQSVCRNGKEIVLSPTEYRILEYLALRPRAIVSKSRLLEHLYDFDWEHHSNVIEVHISNLRKKMQDAGAEQVIETMRHRGYRFSGEL